MIGMKLLKFKRNKGEDERSYTMKRIGEYKLFSIYKVHSSIHKQSIVFYSVRKVSDLFFCENLVRLNEARLHEGSLNLHSHVCIFSRLPIASVDGKQHWSGVVFSALVGFSIKGK